MVEKDFYNRPMVKRINRLFRDPKPPKLVTEQQFDNADDDLRVTARKRWHEIGQEDYWHYLLDLCYVDLQQDLFDYLFPAFLIKWWEGQINRTGGPESECDFYRAIDNGQVFVRMMEEKRRNGAYAWMVDAYIEGLDQWGGHLSTTYVQDGPDNLHGPLWSFHALGQSVPIIGPILERLVQVSTLGRAQWWLVFASGIAWDENECPLVPPWTPEGGGGGIYIAGSSAAIYGHGYWGENLRAFQKEITYSTLVTLLRQSSVLLENTPCHEWMNLTISELEIYPEHFAARIERLFQLLYLDHLGGRRERPLDYSVPLE